MRYPVIAAPARILEQKTKEVQIITDEIITLLDNMYETMVAHDGVGLAAPQIGKKLSIALVDADEEVGLLELINPEIIELSDETEEDVEGCLSFPGLYGIVSRSVEITVRFFDRDGDEYELEASGYLARAIQHEVDHLNGILFTSKIIKELSESELVAYMEEKDND